MATTTIRAIEPVNEKLFHRDRQCVAVSNGKSTLGLITADALAGLKSLPSDVFNVVVTSPPYYWARDYDIEGQIGHEESVALYVDKLASIFDEVRRVLHPEGVFYLNLGDTYYSGNGQPHGSDPRSPSRNFMRRKLRAVDRSGWSIPKKSLIGVPWRLAFALQERGWTLRSDIIWNRGNAFAEPTALDRPHRQYEHVFLFTKSRFYSYDRQGLEGDGDVWNIPINRAKLIEHSAAFPPALVRRCIQTGSPAGGHVLDPFVGSGTTLDVALELGRNCIGIELKPDYTREILYHLKHRFCAEVPWADLTSQLSSVPHGWKSWCGNKMNFKKPRPTR